MFHTTDKNLLEEVNLMWFKDEKLMNLSMQHDSAIDNENINLMKELIETSIENGNNVECHPMIRAHHYYNAATTIGDLNNISASEDRKIEESIEKTLFLFRESITLQEEYLYKQPLMETEEFGYWKVLYNSSIVNYSNVLSSVGRIPSAVQEIKKVAKEGFSMAVGNLGGYLKHYAQLDYDTDHKMFFIYEMIFLMRYAIQHKDSSLHPYAEARFNKDIEESIKYFEGQIIESIDTDEIMLFKESEQIDWYDVDIDEELRYQNWKVSNSLVLNTLNDYDTSLARDNDVLHLPSMIRPLKEHQPIFSGFFNQIKQEYCSARYFIFDGIYNKELHFSDKDVFLVNMYDYPVYGINVEKIKAGYRAIYSLFDSIAYLLNEYFELGKDRDKVSFNNIWSFKNKDGNKITDLSESNYLLKSLYWIKKDIFNETKSGYSGKINTKLHRANKIRNSMEHKYLKIVEQGFIDSIDVKDKLADIIVERSEFEDLSIELLKILRETIILLTQVIYYEENNKDVKLAYPYTIDKYNDEWKI